MTTCPATVNIVTPLTLEKTAKSSCENIRPTLTTTVTLIAAHVVSQTTMILSRLDWPPMNLPQTRCRCSLQASQHSWHRSQAAAQRSKVYHKLFSHDNDFLVAQSISLNNRHDCPLSASAAWALVHATVWPKVECLLPRRLIQYGHGCLLMSN